MISIDISIRSNLKDIQKKLSAFAYKQVPFATATALTSLAKLVRDEEVKNLAATFKNPSPFTLRSARIIAACKDNLVAMVFVMDKAAGYLKPYEDGGVHKLNSKALLNPKDIPLNQYGQLRKGTLASLKARSDIFIGPVKTKKGIVNGVWQREAASATVTMTKAGKLIVSAARRGFNKTGHLKLPIRFGDALPVQKHLGYRARARKIVNANFNAEFGKTLAKSMATAKEQMMSKNKQTAGTGASTQVSEPTAAQVAAGVKELHGVIGHEFFGDADVAVKAVYAAMSQCIDGD